MPTGVRNAGEFCWINMLTPEPMKAMAFFGTLLGWTYSEIPGMGHTVQVGGRNIGGLFDLAGSNTPPGTPPLIGVMVKVQSAAATVTRVTSLGGKAMPAFDIGDQGRMAVCIDPTGANLDVWEAKRSHGTDVDSTQHGAPSWFELFTSDVGRAAKFYTELFGWTSEGITGAGGVAYTLFKRDNLPIAGMMQITEQMGNMPPHWTTYFTVKDADETVSEAVRFGGKACTTMKEVAGVGRFCGITSPQGVTFFIIQYVR